MLSRVTVIVYCENHVKNKYNLWKNTMFLYVKASGTHHKHLGLKGEILKDKNWGGGGCMDSWACNFDIRNSGFLGTLQGFYSMSYLYLASFFQNTYL
jgi:hypothetical protein